ncbi:MAG: YCF48-related protein [Patescibacteria group bacterium]|jgi:photosystem II stability/assembly factor-like uncharacterized protein
MNKKLLLSLGLLISVFSLSGCSLSFNAQNAVNNDFGGVFVTSNKGDVWRQMAVMPSITGVPESIGSLDVTNLVIDPSDPAAVYMPTLNEGLYYTYNVTKGWNKAATLPRVTINDVAIDAKNKCNIYAAIGNKLYKSVDCNRNWSEVYFDNNPNVQISAVAVDHYISNSVYIGTSRGEVIKSLDGGNTWQTIQRLNDGVRHIAVHSTDSRIVFVASVKNGLYRFNSNEAVNLDQLSEYQNKFDGTNWMDLNAELKEFNLGFNFKSLEFSTDNSIFLASDKVLLKSVDNGASWAQIKLITPEKETMINAFAVNPKNSNELYYVTNTTFYRSADGGSTWTTKQLPTSRAGSALLIDPVNPSVIYMGIEKTKK